MSLELSVVAHPTKRLYSIFIDGFINGILILPVLIISYQQQLIQNEEFLLVLYFFLYKVLIYVVFDGVIPYFNRGRTIGRMTQQIRLVQVNGRSAEVTHYLRRISIFLILGIIGDVLLLGWVSYLVWTLIAVTSMILLFTHEHRQTVHDLCSKTMVVNDARVIDMEEE